MRDEPESSQEKTIVNRDETRRGEAAASLFLMGYIFPVGEPGQSREIKIRRRDPPMTKEILKQERDWGIGKPRLERQIKERKSI